MGKAVGDGEALQEGRVTRGRKGSIVRGREEDVEHMVRELNLNILKETCEITLSHET